jgi:transposase
MEEWVAVVGVDWGDKEHAYTSQGADGTRICGKISSAAEEVHAWVQELKQRYPNGTIVVGVEQGRGSLLYALAQYEFMALVPINPRASKAYRDSLRLSGASSDRSDAELICEFTVKHLSSLHVWQPDDAATRKVRMLSEHRRALVDQRTRATHALAAMLKMFFPQALVWFGGESSPVLRAFLLRWPTLSELRAATVEELVEVFRSRRCRKIRARAEALHEQLRCAVAITTDPSIISAGTLYVRAQIALTDVLHQQIEEYERAIAQAWSEHPDREIFDSLPGAGPVLAPRLGAALGTDRTRFHNAFEIECYSGIAPVIEQSGNTCWVHARWSYPKFLHQTFFEFAQASIPHSAWARAVYLEQRHLGADHHEAIRALAFRWIRIIFAMWKNGAPYDEQKHIARLRQTASPIIARLAA